MANIQDLKHHFIRARINAKSSHQKKQCVKPHLSWKKGPCQASKPCEENKDQSANRRFMRWIFDPGGHL